MAGCSTRAAAVPAIVLISEDLDELLRLSDRVAVMHRGRLSADHADLGRHRARARPAHDRAGAACGLSPAPIRPPGCRPAPRSLAIAAGPGAGRGAAGAGRRRPRRRLPADGGRQLRLLVRAQRDPDPGHALDPHRPRRRRGVPRPACGTSAPRASSIWARSTAVALGSGAVPLPAPAPGPADPRRQRRRRRAVHARARPGSSCGSASTRW